MNNRRLILAFIFGISLFGLYDAWQRAKHPAAVPSASASTPSQSATPVPGASAPDSASTQAALATVGPDISKSPRMVVETDTMRVEISATGGDLVHLELLKHGVTGDPKQPYVLFDDGKAHVYLAQSGFIEKTLVNHRTLFSLPASRLTLADGQEALTVKLDAAPVNGVKVAKTLTFHRGSYQVDVGYEINNGGTSEIAGTPYFQFERDKEPAEKAARFGAQTYTGPAFYENEGHFRKIEFKDIASSQDKIPKRTDNGWVAMVQHYFVAAYLPKSGQREFFARSLDNGLYSAGVILPTVKVAPGQKAEVSVPLYAGPQEQSKLVALAPGFEAVVDYGNLAIFAKPLFWGLDKIHMLVGNWGWAIILLTVLVKLIFFPLSAASYRSMAKMSTLMPQMKRIQEQYADDAQKKNQAMMELYKREKVNPMGGCWPMLIQIPVFIALYWVLLGSVEMRQAPWLGWITDLSLKDPYYILPIIMGASSLIQTKLNPTPADPVQAKVMTFMPLIFTFMFLWFPSGLVLYWVVNNILSIAQQWYIKRMFNDGGSKKASKA